MRISSTLEHEMKGHETGGIMTKNSHGRTYLKLLPHGEPALETYIDPVGVPTIGWGQTGREATIGRKITRDEAEAMFRRTVGKFEEQVTASLVGGAPTNQNQFDALFSFAYNVGIGALRSSSVLRHHKAGRYERAANSFALWNKGRINGRLQVLRGLVRRRADEAARYMRPVAADAVLSDTIVEVEEDEMVMDQAATVAAEPPKSLTKSTTIVSAATAGLSAIPITVEGAKAVQSGAEQLKGQAASVDALTWMVPIFGLVIMLVTAYLIWNRWNDRQEGSK